MSSRSQGSPQPQREISDRTARLHSADRIACPRCETPLRRVASGEGALVATCDARQPVRPGERYGRPCGQAFYVWSSADAVATVIPLERHELEILSAQPTIPTKREALELLGVLRRRSPAIIPSHPCAKCQTLTKLTELYAGHCRSCAGLEMPRAAHQ